MLTVVFLAGFYGCSEGTNTSSNLSDIDLESPDFAILDFDDAMECLNDATLETDFNFGDFPANNGMGHRFGNRNDNHPPFRGRHFHRIFRELDLTSDQIDLIKDFMNGHKDCMSEAFIGFREANEEIITAAREERREIIQQIHDEVITREEGHELLRELNERTREAVRNNPESILAHEEMCSCKLILLDNIRTVLNADQQVIWDEWVGALEGSCFTDG